jgi:hypothetical protein
MAATRPSGFTVFLVGTSLALAILVVVLSSQNRALKQALARERTQQEDREQRGRAGATFATGETLPPLGLLAGGGTVERLEFDGQGRGTLLLFYAETCNVCPQVFLSWEELAPQFTAAGVRVAAVQLDRTNLDNAFGPPAIPSFALADFSSVPLAKIATVPVTLLLDARGAVRWAHYGTLTPHDMSALVAFLP